MRAVGLLPPRARSAAVSEGRELTTPLRQATLNCWRIGPKRKWREPLTLKRVAARYLT
jgi:hypothetical protein